MNRILVYKKSNESKKKYYLVFVVLIFLIAFSFFLLYRHFLFQKIFSVFQDKIEYCKDCSIDIGKTKGGILTDLVLYNVDVKKKHSEQFVNKILNIPKFRVNLSIKKLFFSYFSDNPISNIDIFIEKPTFYTDNFYTDFVYSANSFFSSILTFLNEDFLNFIQLSQVKVKVYECSLVEVHSKKKILNNFNTEIILKPQNDIIFKKTVFNLLGFPLSLNGELNIESKSLDLNINSDSDIFKFNILLFGKLNNCNVVSNFKLLKNSIYHVDGIIGFKNSKIFFENLNIEPKSKRSEGRNSFISQFFNEESTIYIVNGVYDYIGKKADFEIKGGFQQSKRYQQLYYDECDFNRLFAVECNLSNFPKFDIEFKIKRLMLENLNYISNLYFKGQFGVEHSYILKGHLSSQGSILNYKPFYEFTSEFKLTSNDIKLSNFNLENIASLNFSFALKDKHRVNLKLNTMWVDIDDFIHQFYPEIIPGIKGDMKLKLSLSGSFKDPDINGNAIVKNGIINESVFRIAELNFKGDKERLKFYNSKVFQEDSFYDIHGEINLIKIKKPGFLEEMELVSTNKAFTWKGWTFSNVDEEGEVELEKILGKGFKIGFSTYLNNQLEYENKPTMAEDGLELEYSLSQDKSLKLEFKEDEEILRLQKSIEF